VTKMMVAINVLFFLQLWNLSEKEDKGVSHTIPTFVGYSILPEKLIVGTGNQIQIYSLPNLEVIQVIPNTGKVFASLDGKIFFLDQKETTTQKKELKVWDVTQAKVTDTLLVREPDRLMALSNGKIVCLHYKWIELWDLYHHHGDILVELTEEGESIGTDDAIDFDGRLLFFARSQTGERFVQIWDLATRARLHLLVSTAYDPMGISQYCVMKENAKSLQIRDQETLEIVQRLTFQKQISAYVGINDQQLAVWLENGEIQLWG